MNEIALVVGNGGDWKSFFCKPNKKVTVYRVNNFFFENKYYFGKRIDVLFIGYDKHIFKNYMLTLDMAISQNGYKVKTLKCCNRMAKKVSGVSITPTIINPSDQIINSKNCSNITTGTLAILDAVSHHRLVYAVNFDFYKQRGYPFSLVGWAKRVIHSERSKGYNHIEHDIRLENKIISQLTRSGRLILIKNQNNLTAIENIIPNNAKVAQPKTYLIQDWIFGNTPIRFHLKMCLRVVKMKIKSFHSQVFRKH